MSSEKSFAFMLKTYSHDIKYATNLLESFHKFNRDSIQLYIVVPKFEVRLFSHFQNETCIVIAEESIPEKFTSVEVGGISPGYINQQLVKLAFWKLRLCQNYLCLDADGVFIRDFYVSDFMATPKDPYTVLIEDRDLQTDPEYYSAYWKFREEDLKKIRKFLELDSALVPLTCHGFQIFSTSILEKFEADILNQLNITFLDLLEISPYEFSWYNYYLQSTSTKIYPREPFFKYYHTRRQLLNSKLSGITQIDLARGYIGHVVNSNLTGKSKNPMIYDISLTGLLRKTLPISVLLPSTLGRIGMIPILIWQRYLKRLFRLD